MRRIYRDAVVVVAFICTALLFVNMDIILLQRSPITTVKPDEVQFSNNEEEYTPFNDSTCSKRATNRGPNQNVVSFSFFGDFNHARNYFQGIEENTLLVKKYYPGWVVRVYHDIPETDAVVIKLILDLQKKYNNLDICYAFDIPGFGDVSDVEKMLWRFLPIADPLVDIFLSRDLDSRISEREVVAVNEWLNTSLAVHVMRDHPNHWVEILGGLWGAKVFMERELLYSLMTRLLKEGHVPERMQVDQNLLRKIVWPKIQGKILQHDSYLCKDFSKYGNLRPWPTKRSEDSYNFVGAVIGMNANGVKVACPEECRPIKHKDWEMC